MSHQLALVYKTVSFNVFFLSPCQCVWVCFVHIQLSLSKWDSRHSEKRTERHIKKEAERHGIRNAQNEH